jgi:serine protease AprX
MRPAPMLIRLLVPLVLLAVLAPATSAQIGPPLWRAKVDPLLDQRVSVVGGRSRIIVRAMNAASLQPVTALVSQLGGVAGRALPIIDSVVADVPHAVVPLLAGNPLVQRLTFDRLVVGALERTAATIGATTVWHDWGYDGSGIGVAVIDSGVTSWHDDLAAPPAGAQRVDAFVDLVNGRSVAYDDHGHGSHVAGIIAGNGHDSGGARSGIAPAARLLVVKVLDAAGRGRISDVIAGLGAVLLHQHALDIRVVNLSLAAGVYESYNLDPLTLAAQRVVAAGIVVVAAAGNNGRDPQGRTSYAGTTAPGNAPWVLTVGASSHQGTMPRADDTVAPFSSRGPAAIDYAAKPDIVAPGVGTESLSDPNSALYVTRSAYLLDGTVPTPYRPYLSLSGTSMSAPVVAGTVALMLQANPLLTPNQVKAILHYTAQVYSGHDPLTQGAGFLNAHGAVELARFFAASPTGIPPLRPGWSGRLIWGNQMVQGGRLTASAIAWSPQTTWGAARTATGLLVDWGVIAQAGTWSRWGVECSGFACSDVRWGDGESQNVVWGSTCGGDDCPTPWSIGTVAHILSGSANATMVVWGTSYDEIVVWGTSCTDPSCEPVLWDDQ